jgi:AcrR family transcriptional regulator
MFRLWADARTWEVRMNDDAQLVTHGKIISAAAGLVARRGATPISSDDICEAAGVTRAEFREHFADETAVMARVRAAVPRVTLESPMDQALRGLDSIEAVRAWAERYVEALGRGDLGDESVLCAISGRWAAAESAVCADVGAMLGRWTGTLSRGLGRMREGGVLRPEADPDELASALLAMLLGGILLARTREDVTPLRAAVTAMMARIHSLATESGQLSPVARCRLSGRAD